MVDSGSSIVGSCFNIGEEVEDSHRTEAECTVSEGGRIAFFPFRFSQRQLNIDVTRLR